MEQLNRKRIVGLVRVSTTAQANVEFGSLDQQINMLKRWATDMTSKTGIQFDLKEEHIFSEDESGRADSISKRNGLRQVRSMIRNRECDIVVVEKLDRLGRDQTFNRLFVSEANDKDVEVYEVDSGIINLKDRGSRLSFNIKNMIAEEYSLDLEEKITKKQREANVNNGKDTSTSPTLGLDSHPVRAGFYERNEREIAILRNIFLNFIETQSYKLTIEYCKEMGYLSKSKMIKEKIVKGKKILARPVGGEAITHAYLYNLFTNPKIRGQNKFNDTYNQFSSLQDKEGFVTWTYEHGPLLEKVLFQKTDAVLEKLKTHYVREKKEGGYYLLTGLLKASDGTAFHGVSAKSGQNRYYFNKASKKRIPCHILDEIVCNRVKQYLLDSNILESAFAVSMKHATSHDNPLQDKLGQTKKETKRLEATLKGFSETLRATALSDSKNLLEVTKIISAEKAKIEAELESLRGLLVEGERKLKMSHLEKSPKLVSDYLKIAMHKFDSVTAEVKMLCFLQNGGRDGTRTRGLLRDRQTL